MIESDYDRIIKHLPDTIHLHTFNGFTFPWELEYKISNLPKEMLRKLSYQTLLKVEKFVKERRESTL